MSRIWECKIGETDSPEIGAGKGMDLPMREAIAEAYERITGEQPTFIFSGWGGQLTISERCVVEDREPTDAERKAMGY